MRQGTWTREIAGALIYAAIGMVVEVFVTGLPRLFRGSTSALGQVSVLMAILYMIVYWVAPWLFRQLTNWKITNRYGRAFCVVILIYGFEWSFGATCRACGFTPWTYTGIKPEWVTSFSDGNICLLLFPLWYLYALVLEPVLKCIRIMVAELYDRRYLTWKNFWGLTANEKATGTPRPKVARNRR